MLEIVGPPQGATRNRPITDELRHVLEQAAARIGVDKIVITSGGQPALGDPGERLGSTRHDHGRAADIQLFRAGRPLTFTDQDGGQVAAFVTAAAACGSTGIGAGVAYMGDRTIHVGFGSSPADKSKLVWGANGDTATAPAWLVTAARDGWNSPSSPVTSIPSAGGVGRHLVIARGGLWLRKGPGLDFEKDRLLAEGLTVGVTRYDGPDKAWACVDIEGDGLADGFAFAAFLAPVGVVAQQHEDTDDHAGVAIPIEDLKPGLRLALRLHEIGDASPYRLFFAGKGTSGASFGFMQGDLNAGQTNVTATFRNAMSASRFSAVEIDSLLARLAIHLLENPLSQHETLRVNAALLESKALVDAMDEGILQDIYTQLARCTAAAQNANRQIVPKALIYMALWINMTGPPTKLLDWLGGGDPGLQTPLPPLGNTVQGADMEGYLKATEHYTENPQNLPHLLDSAARGAAALVADLEKSVAAASVPAAPSRPAETQEAHAERIKGRIAALETEVSNYARQIDLKIADLKAELDHLDARIKADRDHLTLAGTTPGANSAQPSAPANVTPKRQPK